MIIYTIIACILAFTVNLLAAEDVLIKKTAEHVCALSSQKKKSRIAIQPFTDEKDQESPDSKKCTTYIINYILNCGNIKIIDPGKVKKVLEEQEKGMTGIIDDETAPAAGKLLGADAILFGQVDGKVIQIRMVDAATGEILGAKVEETGGNSTTVTKENFSDDTSKVAFRNEQHRKQLNYLFNNRPLIFILITSTGDELAAFKQQYPRRYEKAQNRLDNNSEEKKMKFKKSRNFFLDARIKDKKFDEKIIEEQRMVLSKFKHKEQ